MKKYMVALVMALNILLCRFMEARMQTDTNVADLTSVANIMENVKTANTMMHVCRETVHHKIVSDTRSVVAGSSVPLPGATGAPPDVPLSAPWKQCSSRLTLNDGQIVFRRPVYNTPREKKNQSFTSK